MIRLGGIGRARMWLGSGTIGWRLIRRPCLLGRYHRTVFEGSRFRGSCDWWFAMVRRSSQLRLRPSSLGMLSLNRDRRNMSLMCDSLLLRRWTRIDPPITAVVADPVHRRIVHGGVVNI